MRKSLHETQQIENYIFGRMNVYEQQEFNVQLLIHPHLQKEVDAQKTSYTLIKTYGRKKLKAELNAVHKKLFTHPEKKGFRQLIKNIFDPKK